jgi:GR25 family glycosyltransferase involved in LPS biosynthesis
VIFLLILFSPFCMFAEIADCLKKATNKESATSIKNVDFIYVINLDERPEKYKQTQAQFLEYDIVTYRFSAVNGWKLDFNQFADLGVLYNEQMPDNLMGTYYSADDPSIPVHEFISRPGQRYFCHCMTKGAVGIVLSHLSVLKDALDSNYDTIWVMEDDVQIIQNPHVISNLIRKLDETVGKENWDVLFTDQDTKDRNGNYVRCKSFARRPNFNPKNPQRFLESYRVGKFFKKIGARYGAYSMIIRKSGAKKIYDFIVKNGVFLPYDMEYTLPDDIRLFCVYEDIVSTIPTALSDNGSPNYLTE